MTVMKSAIVLILAVLSCAAQTERTVDPTFLVRHLSSVAAKASDITTASCAYKPLFGEGDPNSVIVRGVARFGEVTVTQGGACKAVRYRGEEQAYVIMEGAGAVRYAGNSAPLKKHDFFYLPLGVELMLSAGASPLRVLVVGFHLAADSGPPSQLTMANIDDIQKQTVGSHPDSVVYQ